LKHYANKYVDPPYCRAEINAGRISCCPLVNHGEYADVTDRRTDARPVTLCCPLNAASVIKTYKQRKATTFTVNPYTQEMTLFINDIYQVAQ